MLKLQLDNLDGVEENVKGLYSQGADGKWRLGVDGLPDVDKELSGIKANRDKILEEKKALEKKVAEADKAAKEAAEKAQREYEEKLKAADRALNGRARNRNTVQANAIQTQKKTRTARTQAQKHPAANICKSSVAEKIVGRGWTWRDKKNLRGDEIR